MPFQQVFELKDTGQIHGSRLVDQSVNLGVKGMPGSLTAELFPETLDMRSNELKLDRILLEGGDKSRPAIAWRVDEDVGFYKPGSNGSLAMTVDGTRVFSFGSTVLRLGQGTNSNSAAIRTDEADGASQPTYSFIGDMDTGMYRKGADDLAFATGGTGWWYIATGGDFRSVPGLTSSPRLTMSDLGYSSTNPAFTFEADDDTGMYHISADNLGFATGGSKQMDITSGRVMLQPGVLEFEVSGGGGAAVRFNNSGPHGLEIYQGGSLESALYYRTTPDTWSFENSSGQIRLEIDIDGNFVDVPGSTDFRISGTSHGSASGAHVTNGNSHNHNGGDGGQINHGHLAGLGDINDHTWAIIDGGTTTASANTWFGGARSIKVVTSQLRNKTSISPLLAADEHPHMVPSEKRTERRYPFSVLDITPIQFKSVLDGDDSRIVRTGFLWEDVEENYPAGTQDESLDVNALIAGILVEVKQLRQEVDDLKGQLNELTR